jgi:hypothetical protein
MLHIPLSHYAALLRALRDDRGEGVISTAIAVLVVAFIGAAMWVAFNSIWNDSEDRIRDNVEDIGTDS